MKSLRTAAITIAGEVTMYLLNSILLWSFSMKEMELNGDISNFECTIAELGWSLRYLLPALAIVVGATIVIAVVVALVRRRNNKGEWSPPGEALEKSSTPMLIRAKASGDFFCINLNLLVDKKWFEKSTFQKNSASSL